MRGIHHQLPAFAAGDIQPGHPVQYGAAVVRIAGGGGDADEVDVLRLQQQGVFGADPAAGVVQGVLRLQSDFAALDAAAVVQVLRAQIHDAAAGDGAAVVQAV